MLSFTARRVAVRSFATSARLNKSAVDTAKDAVKAVDNTVSKAAVAGIEKGEQLAESAKKATNISSGEAKGKAHEIAGQAKGKAEELKGQAKGAAADVQSKI